MINTCTVFCVLTAQVCLTLWPMDYSPQGSSVHGILQARIVECILFSGGSSQPKDQSRVSSTAGRFFTIWATWEVHIQLITVQKSTWSKTNRSEGRNKQFNINSRDSPGGPVGKALCFPCRALSSILGQGTRSPVPQLKIKDPMCHDLDLAETNKQIFFKKQ